MIRHLYSIFVVVFFLVMATFLVRDHVLPEWRNDGAIAISTTQIVDAWSNRDEWMTVEVNGVPAGAIRTVVGPESEAEGYLAQMKFVLGRGEIPGTITSAARMNANLEITRMRARILPTGKQEGGVEIGGGVFGNRLRLAMRSNSGERFHEIGLNGPITMNVAAEPLMSPQNMEPGKRYSLEVYDPIWGMQAGRMVMELEGTEPILVDGHRMQATKVRATMPNTTTWAWIGPNGDTMRREIHIHLGGKSTGTADNGGDNSAPLVVRLDRILSRDRMDEYPALWKLPEPPEYSLADLTGEDQGRPLASLGVLPYLFQGQLDSILKESKEPNRSRESP